MVPEVGREITPAELEAILPKAMRAAAIEPHMYKPQAKDVRVLQGIDLIEFGLEGLLQIVGVDAALGYVLSFIEPGGDIADGWMETYLYVPAYHLMLEIDTTLWLQEWRVRLMSQYLANERRYNRRRRMKTAV